MRAATGLVYHIGGKACLGNWYVGVAKSSI